jgi:hypothetical protein
VLVVAVVGAVTSCEPGPVRTVGGGTPVIAVLAPRGGERDVMSTLVDHAVGPSTWYCSHAPPPQRFELMFPDGEPRVVTALGFVPGNLGPDGVGPVEVRVQTGHGVAAAGRTFRAEVRGREAELQVVALPHPVQGDHVVLSLLRRSPFATAQCLGELLVFVAGQERGLRDATVVQAAPVEETRAGRGRGARAPDAAVATADAAVVEVGEAGVERGDAGAAEAMDTTADATSGVVDDAAH